MVRQVGPKTEAHQPQWQLLLWELLSRFLSIWICRREPAYDSRTLFGTGV